jgi:hypothetical protein
MSLSSSRVLEEALGVRKTAWLKGDTLGTPVTPAWAPKGVLWLTPW